MRILDFITGVVGLPFLALSLGVLRALGLRFNVEKTIVVGEGARPFWRHRLVFHDGKWATLAERLGLAHAPDCVALLRGRLALVGPRPLSPPAPHSVASYRTALRPGLISPFKVRPAGLSTAHSEDTVDFAYRCTRTWQGDLDILARAVRSALQPSIAGRAERTAAGNRRASGARFESLGAAHPQPDTGLPGGAL